MPKQPKPPFFENTTRFGSKVPFFGISEDAESPHSVRFGF